MGVTVVEETNRVEIHDRTTLTVTQVVPTIQVGAGGPQGATGPQGPRGPAGDPDVLGYTYTQPTPALLHQIHHGFLWKPAGIVCQESDGTDVEYASLSHPLTGTTEISFGFPFSGVIYLS